MSGRVTLSDVAATAGVSLAAASKVFNDRHDVSAATATRVRQAASELGYRAPTRKSTSDQVNIWVTIGDTLNNYYAPQVVSGMVTEAHEAGALTIVTQGLGSTRNPAPATKKWMTNAHRSGAQAFIFVTTQITEQLRDTAAQLATPLVAVDPFNRPPHGVATIGATNFRGGRDATQHLIQRGHQRIAFIGAAVESAPGGERLAGYLDALRQAGIDADPQLIVPGSFDLASGHHAVRLLDTPKPPTAVFAASDAVAFGFYDACHQQGIRIPEDVSVVGFDDALGSELVWPHLTTVRQPLPEMGRHAVRTCVAAVRSGKPPAPPIELATTLIIRDSTAPPGDVRVGIDQ